MRAPSWTVLVGAVLLLAGGAAVWARRRPHDPASVGTVLRGADYGMIPLRPGIFQMGSPADEPERYDDETLHRVRLTRPFAIGATEVTGQLWLRVEDHVPPEAQGIDPRRALAHVNWFAAVNFCNRLSIAEGLTPAYAIGPHAGGKLVEDVRWDPDANGYRLPTEAEWEFAARAGSTAAYGEVVKRRNAWGLYDTSGELWEWVWDRPGPYPAEATDPSGPDHGYFHVLRGGSWRTPDRMRRLAARGWSPTFASDETVGFRLARTITLD